MTPADFEPRPEAKEIRLALIEELATGVIYAMNRQRGQGGLDDTGASDLLNTLSLSLVGLSQEFGETLGETLESVCRHWVFVESRKKKGLL